MRLVSGRNKCERIRVSCLVQKKRLKPLEFKVYKMRKTFMSVLKQQTPDEQTQQLEKCSTSARSPGKPSVCEDWSWQATEGTQRRELLFTGHCQ